MQTSCRASSSPQFAHCRAGAAGTNRAEVGRKSPWERLLEVARLGRVSKNNNSGGHIGSNHCAGPNSRTRADVNALQNDRANSDPSVIVDLYRPADDGRSLRAVSTG